MISLREQLSTVTLATDFIGPVFCSLLFLAGWIPSYSTILPIILVSYIPQYILLRLVISSRPQLHHSGNKTDIQDAMTNPFSVIYRNFSVVKRHPALLLIMSDFCLSFNIFSPQNMILLAYLRWANINYVSLGFFVAGYALVGSHWIGRSTYQVFNQRYGPYSIGVVYLLIEALFLLLATFIIGLSFGITAGKQGFIAMVALSAFGVYGFKLAKSKLMDQLLGLDTSKKQIEQLDSAFSNLSTLMLLLLGIIDNNPAHFMVIIVMSFLAVILGIVLYVIWQCTHRERPTRPVGS